MRDNCDGCHKIAMSYHYVDGIWLCKHCVRNVDAGFYFKELAGNPYAPKATSAHDRDLDDRRWHPTEKRMFYHSKELGKTYFFPKG